VSEKLAHKWHGNGWIVLFILICTAALIVSIVTPSSVAAYSQHTQGETNAQVTINAGTSLASIPGTAFGINDAAWDGHLLDPAIPGMLQQDGINVMRYPGGSTSDFYHWQSNTVETCNKVCGGVDSSDTFDAFMGVVRKAGAQAMITVNYGSGTPQEAADWVQYANKGGPAYKGPVPTYAGGNRTGHIYGIKYWEIGNEVYGNGTYGSTWEYDKHSLGPAAYAKNVVSYSKAMKAVDPSIKVGVVLTAPGNWPDGQTSQYSPQPWNNTVLPIACSSIDFVVVHWYAQGPNGESDSGLLGAAENGDSTTSSTPSIPSMVSTLHSEINQYCGSHASAVQIMITETNSVSYNPGKQTANLVNALFLDDNYMQWLENGVANVDWWGLHNGIVTGNNASSSLYGAAQYGDYGILSSGASSNGVSEPPANTPFPAYYGLQMLNKLGAAGDQIVSASSDHSPVAVYAVKQANGNLAVLLINKDPGNTYLVKLSLSGYAPAPNATAYFYGKHSRSIKTSQEHGLGPDYQQTVPPYSLTTLVLSPSGH
jgi:hypothetical protein